MTSDNSIKKISVVIPVYNEQGSIAALHKEILDVMSKFNLPHEIIFVDDGSTDSTFDQLKKISPVKIIKFRRNFGQTAALDAGIKSAKGDVIITMDGDGQDDPDEISKLLEKMKQGNFDVVAGWRRKRKDNFLKKISSKAAALLRKVIVNDGIHDSGCTLKAYRKECFNHLDLVGEMHRFIPALLKIKGFKIGETEVNHRPRIFGETKYSWKRGMRGGLDMLSVWFWKKYSSRPLHLFGGMGLLLIFISFISIAYALYEKIIYGLDLSSTALTDLSMFGFLIGIQFFVFGLLADVLSKTYFASTRDTVYDIKEIVENEKKS